MMLGRKMINNLIVIYNGILETYFLDDKLSWNVGRLSKSSNPDIKLDSITVSRNHGKFENMDGIWFYIDNSHNKNGTFYNNKKIQIGLRGNVKPMMLSDGDVFIFGGGDKAVINSKTIWALFLTECYCGEWRKINTRGYTKILLSDGEKKIQLDNPKKGQVIKRENGMAIYMGSSTYLIGDLELLSE